MASGASAPPNRVTRAFASHSAAISERERDRDRVGRAPIARASRGVRRSSTGNIVPAQPLTERALQHASTERLIESVLIAKAGSDYGRSAKSSEPDLDAFAEVSAMLKSGIPSE